MKIKWSGPLFVFALFIVLISVSVLADEYAYTQAYFNIPSDVSFFIALPGDPTPQWESSETSPPTTAWISFNASSTLPDYFVEPWTLGVDNSLNRQDGSSYPIFYVENYGNTPIDFHIQIAALDPCLELCANATCGDASCGTASFTGTCTDINGVEAIMANELPSTDGSDHVNITLYANFTDTCTPGEYGAYQITHRSTAD